MLFELLFYLALSVVIAALWVFLIEPELKAIHAFHRMLVEDGVHLSAWRRCVYRAVSALLAFRNRLERLSVLDLSHPQGGSE